MNNDRKPSLLGTEPSPSQQGKTPKQGPMTNTKVSRSGTGKPTAPALDIKTQGPRDN